MKILKMPVSNQAYELAQRVRKRDLSKAVLGTLNSLPVSSKGLVTIDARPAFNGNQLNQKTWIAYFNNGGMAMISAPNVYRAVSQKDVLDSLRKAFNGAEELTSTNVSYNSNDLGAKVTHNFGSTVVRPTDVVLAKVPIYKGMSAKVVVQNPLGLAYARAVFGTRDKPVKILKTLEQLSGRGAEQILFWTSDKSSRVVSSVNAVAFFDNDEGFNVYGYDNSYDICSRSRGVSVGKK